MARFPPRGPALSVQAARLPRRAAERQVKSDPGTRSVRPFPACCASTATGAAITWPARSAGSGGGPSLDHLIRACQQRRREGEAEGLGGLRRGERTGHRGQQEAAAVHHSCPSSTSCTACRNIAAIRASRSCQRCSCRRRLRGRPALPRANRFPACEACATCWAGCYANGSYKRTCGFWGDFAVRSDIAHGLSVSVLAASDGRLVQFGGAGSVSTVVHGRVSSRDEWAAPLRPFRAQVIAKSRGLFAGVGRRSSGRTSPARSRALTSGCAKVHGQRASLNRLARLLPT